MLDTFLFNGCVPEGHFRPGDILLRFIDPQQLKFLEASGTFAWSSKSVAVRCMIFSKSFLAATWKLSDVCFMTSLVLVPQFNRTMDGSWKH